MSKRNELLTSREAVALMTPRAFRSEISRETIWHLNFRLRVLEAQGNKRRLKRLAREFDKRRPQNI